MSLLTIYLISQTSCQFCNSNKHWQIKLPKRVRGRKQNILHKSQTIYHMNHYHIIHNNRLKKRGGFQREFGRCGHGWCSNSSDHCNSYF